MPRCHRYAGRLVPCGLALGVVALLIGACAAPVGGIPTPTRSATATAVPTASPSIPTLRYTIGTRNQTLHELANLALPVIAGTNDRWTPAANWQELSCGFGETADPGGAAGREVYQVYTCRLAAGAVRGTGSFNLVAAGATTRAAVAQLEVDSLSATPASSPDLTFQITTSPHFHAAASIALAVNAGTNFQWTPAANFAGLTCTSDGIAHPEGPAGHVQYQVFTCQLAAGQTSGQGSFTFAEIGTSTPTETAQLKVALSS